MGPRHQPSGKMSPGEGRGCANRRWKLEALLRPVCSGAPGQGLFIQQGVRLARAGLLNTKLEARVEVEQEVTKQRGTGRSFGKYRRGER